MGQVIPFITRVSARGEWSREERARLAELAERYAAAGVRVEVIYGETEEGDPWCVVKDEFEEVLIHVARIGDTFVVHYALDDALRQGQDLRSVLSERLAWEERPEVVVPFSRHAQSLLALIVATGFYLETVRPNEDEPPAIANDPLDDPSVRALGASPANALPGEMAMASKAAHVGGLGFLALGATGFESGTTATWRSFADDAPLARTDHGGVALARFTPGGSSGPIANIDVAPAPHLSDAPRPIVMAFNDHPRASPSPPPSGPTTGPTASTTNGFGTTQVSELRTENHPSEPSPPTTSENRPAPDRPTEVATHWVEVDTDGDGRPDTRIEVPDEPKHEPRHEIGEVTIAAGHEAIILAVGHGFPHAEFA